MACLWSFGLLGLVLGVLGAFGLGDIGIWCFRAFGLCGGSSERLRLALCFFSVVRSGLLGLRLRVWACRVTRAQRSIFWVHGQSDCS